jgi:hypothetical protein
MMPRSIVLSLMILVLLNSILVDSAPAQMQSSSPNRQTKLTIFVFQDDNKNGSWDSGERGLDNWLFLIKGPGYNNQVSIHSSHGFNIPPGKYFIKQFPKPNWENTTQLERIIKIDRNKQVSLYFGNYNLTCTNCSTPQINCSWTEPPQVDLTPKTLSFSSSDWDKLIIWVDNPPYSHIINASIELKIPDGWIMKPSTEDTPLDYISNDNALQLEDFGNFKNKSIHDYIDIKPEEGVSGDNWLTATANINYLYRYPNATYNLSCNATQEFKIKLIIKNNEKGIFETIKDNLIFIVVICSIITLIFGPGGKDRVYKIKNNLKNKKDTKDKDP